MRKRKMKSRIGKIRVLVSIIALVVLMGACGKTAAGDEQGKVFVVSGYDIEITCPSGWKQIDTPNFDLKCINRNDTVNMNVFAFMQEELGEDYSAESLFTDQNQDLIAKRDNVMVLEEETVTESEGRVLYSTLFSADRDGSTNIYYINQVYFPNSGHIAYILFNGIPSEIKRNRDTLDKILMTVKVISQG
ncbi:hypothetical protein GX618_03915 [Candidatus Dojkabacteria bacterium]|uniref:PsbP C-terminal domain-containing protein n=1 Tax=Candidatus Dojkabacteria bacterium TaxID=2099670 RepID=A0A847EV48_9BACT|nr:hypothetical protein [Candidatus Dojkabacteria bacterium]